MAEINPAIRQVLQSYKIDEDEGLLMLLAIYFKIKNVEKIIPEEIVTAINLTKIVSRDYKLNTVSWNMPLFKDETTITGWNWVIDWVDNYGKMNIDRRGNWQNIIPLMQEFFSKYPIYRVEDVIRATNLYLSRVTAPKFLMRSSKFIFDGTGARRISTLLQYCDEVTREKTIEKSDIRGDIIE